MTVGAGETFYSPNLMSTVALPFKSGFTAGFNGTGQTWHPGFLAWNGIGTYSGPIHVFQVSPTNFGYSAGMPQGLYNKNPLGPGGFSAITLNYAGVNGATGGVAATYAIQVVPEPGSFLATVAALSALCLRRRKNR